MSEKRNGQPITTTYEFNFPQPKPKVSVAQFLCNTKDGTCLGRTPASWAKILIFYAIFYAVLAGLFAICLKALFSTLKDNEPKFTLESSLIGTNPGMGYRPLSEATERGSIIRFDTTKPEESDYWIKLLDEFLEPYNNKSMLPNGGKNQMFCDINKKIPANKVCMVDVSRFGECSPKSQYGYKNGRPCVFLKLNKIFNWQPEYYDDIAELPEAMPHDLKEFITKQASANDHQKIWISCSGQQAIDQENMGEIKYYPSRGIESYYYPYKNQPGYLSPLIAVQFNNVTLNQLISIECRAWAKNIIYSGSVRDRKGSVSFQINIDSDSLQN